MTEPTQQFESRKRDHIELALRPENEAQKASGFHRVELIHEALPELDFSEVSIEQKTSFRPDETLATPFLVSSMTAGHQGSVDLNRRLARVACDRGWLMGVGSQRRELQDSEAREEWRQIRRETPGVKLLGNIGIAQLIQTPVEQVEKLVEALQAWAMIVHLNPLQESLQPEGTPQFRGGLLALERLTKVLSVPVVVKETGCGFSATTLKRIFETGVKAVDVSGYGGTHWGRIEGQRAESDSVQAQAAKTFAEWGISTVESLSTAMEICEGIDLRRKESPTSPEIWASGGVRSGLDAAKALAMGARVVGFAKPMLEAALTGETALHKKMETIEFELKTALFCTGSKNINELQQKRVWRWLANTI